MKYTNSVFVVSISLLFTLSSCNNEKEIEAAKEMKASVDQLRTDIEEAVNSEEGYLPDSDALDDVLDATKKLENTASGDDAKLLKVARLHIEKSQQHLIKINSEMENLTNSMNYESVTKIEDLTELSKLTHSYQKMNTEVTEDMKNHWITNVEQNLKKEGVDNAESRKLVQTLKRQLPLALKIRKYDDMLCNSILKQHEILKKHLGEWSWDISTQSIIFQEDDALEAYNKTAIEIQSTAEKQAESQKELLRIR